MQLVKTSSSLLKGISLGLILFALGSSSALRAQDDDEGSTLTLNGSDSYSGSVTLTGTGTLMLTGVNSYIGITNLAGATLSFSGTLVTTTGTLQVNQGTGSQGPISVPASSILNLFEGPKLTDPTTESLYPDSVVDDAQFGTSNTISGFEIIDTALGSGPETITTTANYTGPLSLAGGLPISGGTLTITGGGTGTLTLSGANTYQPAFVTAGALSASGSGGITVDAAPEPSTWIMLAGALGLLAFYRRIKSTATK